MDKLEEYLAKCLIKLFKVLIVILKKLYLLITINILGQKLKIGQNLVQKLKFI
jgi:hypothetical protein